MSKKNVAIQGVAGSFHEQAAQCYYKSECIELIYCKTFDELFLSLQNNDTDAAVMAIENSISGSINQNYDLLYDFNFFISGEIYMQINQNLLALPGIEIEDVNEVFSHPVAIEQSRKFFERHPHIKLTPSLDTALSAKTIWQTQSVNKAAIASESAAIMYGLDVLCRKIQSEEINITRFLVLKKQKGKDSNIDKVSAWFTIDHNVNNLARIFNVLSERNLIVSKIQSFSVPGKDWQYRYFIDLLIHDTAVYMEAMATIKSLTSAMQIIGEYSQGSKYKSS